MLLVHYVTRTESIHAILKTQIKLKLLRSSSPPVSFLGQFLFFFFSPVWAVLLVCFQGSTKHAALLDNRQNRIRCFVVIHMPKTRDKKSLVISSLPPLRRPSAQGAGLKKLRENLKGSPGSSYVYNSWWEQHDVTPSRGTVLG